jgi:eukaryotic-like serine/threonine-protein kinase
MLCQTCQTPLEPNARFCGVCGHRLAPAADKPSSPVLQPPPPAPQPPRPLPKPVPKAEPVDPYLGQSLNNRFRIESKIGEGGFGAVYKGLQLATGRKVALKLLHPEMTADENLVARFRREGLVLCNLRDAHTITTYDFDQTPDGTLYIAMELLEGKSLHEVFHASAPLEWRRVLRILTAMCSSLAEAHAQGIVHRDLKPENIYLEHRSGNPDFVKILDFGIAKVMRGDTIDPQSAQLTATGQTLGTLEYMSPEQLMGKQLDGRSDVYALGVVGYEMITGRLPFPDAKGPAGLITAQLKQTPTAPSVANPSVGLSPAVDRLLLKCLEKDRNQRYADVSAFANAITELLQSTTGESAPAKAARNEMTPVPAAAPPMNVPQPMQHMTSSPLATTPGFGPSAMPSAKHVAGPVSAGNFAPGPYSNPMQPQFPPQPMQPMQGAVMQGYPQNFSSGPAGASYPGSASLPPKRNWFVIGALLVAVGISAGAVLAALL